MSVLVFCLLVFVGSFAAGCLGALTGLGGGVVLVPLLTLALGVHIKYAIGASLISVIATSSGAAAAYIKEGYTNVRIGMLLESATTAGAVAGALIAAKVSDGALAVTFGVVLLVSSYLSGRRQSEERPASTKPDPLARGLGLDSTYPSPDGPQPYTVHNVGGGFTLMGVAGVLSGMLGIGSGALKVLAMDQLMRIPFKVSTTTSNFMIGVTAAASAGVYLNRGYIDPGLVMPVMLGVLSGSIVGARVLLGARTRALRLLFSAVVLFLALQMIYKGLTGAP